MKRDSGRTGAQALVDGLVEAGADLIFGYPGGNVLDIFEAVRASCLRFVLGRHEQGCVHMADGYARALGRPGVVLVTSGPGLTNTITGLGCANMDGVPMVLVCGQVPLADIGTDAFQEADTVGLTRAVSKHNFLVKSADEIPETIAQAFYIATHGKPGPVVIDVPRDCQQMTTSAQYPKRVSLRAYHPECSASPREVARLAKLLNESKRPLIYAGGGVVAADASNDLVRLAHKAQMPVVTTMMGIGAIDERDSLALGMSGVYGTDRANRAIKEADVILALGVRFNDRTQVKTRAKIIHVDCDASSINKNVPVALGIVADIKDLLTTVDSRIRAARHLEWLNSLSAIRMPSSRILPIAFGKHSLLVVTDVGEHQLWAVRNILHTEPRHFITSGGMGAMGFAIPAAIGAAMARPDRKVVALVGDGGAQMTSEELIVAVEENLDITFIVFANGTLGLVKTMQREAFAGRTFATDIRNPDFVKLARAYGLKALHLDGAEDLPAAICRAIRGRGPKLVEVSL